MPSCRESHMLRTNLALAVELMLWTPFDAHATCKQVKAESDILGIRIADEASSARNPGTTAGAVIGTGQDGKRRRCGLSVRAHQECRRQAGCQTVRALRRGRRGLRGDRGWTGGSDPTRVAARRLPANELSRTRRQAWNAAGGAGAPAWNLLPGASAARATRRSSSTRSPTQSTRCSREPACRATSRATRFKNDRLAWFRFGFEYP